MGTIVTIGGGEIDAKETAAIDKEILAQSGKLHPRLLFIPTASSDSEDYWIEIRDYFTGLGCSTDVLRLLKNPPLKSAIEEKILSSDIVFVGGGNTLKMMRLWRRLGVDAVLKTAYEKDIVLSGMSAGSICWYESGHSDSMSYYHPKDWEYIRVKGLGFLRGTHCPHFGSSSLGIPRRKSFEHMMDKIGGIGIAIDDRCAIVWKDDMYKVVSDTPDAHAYRVYKKDGRLITECIEEKDSYSPISDFYAIR